jgi:hypothetical protein
MRRTYRILGLACRVVTLGILLAKFAIAILTLVGGATNYDAVREL